MTQRTVYKRYSEAFKRQVVAEYEEGASAGVLCRKYGIGKVDTVTGWVKQYGREGLRHAVVHIQTPEEADQLRQLEQERDLLQEVVTDLTIQKHLLEGQLQVYEETYGRDALKKNGLGSSSMPTPSVREK
ncbi:MAG: transposase [Anaerolineae bacterium]|nr:transposase [Anaerolineae bacterium]